MKMDSKKLLRWIFWLGAIIDGMIAVSWFLIAGGVDIPNILNGYSGTGTDYRLAMFVAAMFMSGWTAILVWGAQNPVERRGLLIITALFLIISVIVEWVFFKNMLMGTGFLLGSAKRLIISGLFIFAYYRSRKEG